MKEDAGRIIGVISVKGGVGKTTTVSNLGEVISNECGIRCVVVDANVSVPNLGLHLNIIDPKVTLQSILKEENRSISEAVYVHDSGLHVVPASLSEVYVDLSSLEMKMRSLARQYEILIMDSSPGVGEEIKATINSSDELLIVSSLDFPTISATLKAIKLADELNTRVGGIILNRVKGMKYELNIDEVESILEIPVLAVIPEDIKVNEALSVNMPVVLYDPNSPASREYRRLAAHLIGIGYETGYLMRIFDIAYRFMQRLRWGYGRIYR